jgi:hypothetical protein
MGGRSVKSKPEKGPEEWRVIRLAHRGILLGFVQANDKVEALRKASKKFECRERDLLLVPRAAQ